jgi:hypothetical protein
MPLYENAAQLIRINLEEITAGKRVRRVEIGVLSDDHLVEINAFRAANGFPPIIAAIVFIGKHLHKGRIVGDGYTIDDVLEQIESALQPCAELQLTETGTALQNPNRRADKYGNAVRDKMVLECTSHHPYPQLWSVIPTGDKNKPEKKKAT